MDIKNTKEMLDLIMTAVNVEQMVMADGKLSAEDLAALMPLIPKIGPAVEDFKLIKDEMLDLDGAEGTELVLFVGEKANVAGPKAKIYIKGIAEMVLKAYEMAQIFMQMKADLAALEPVAPAPAPAQV